MKLRTFIFQKSLLIITLLYIIALIFINQRGWFAVYGPHDVARFARQTPVIIEGFLETDPEEKNGRLTYILRAKTVNGEPVSGKILVHSFLTDKPVDAGDNVRLTGILKNTSSVRTGSTFNYALYLMRRNIFAVMYPSSVTLLQHKQIAWYRLLPKKIERDIVKTINDYLPAQEAAILSPMIIGDKSNLTDEEKNAFTIAGVTHILVVSGMNVAYCTFIFLIIFRLMGFKRRVAALFTIPFILLYVFVTGATPPVMRAGVMALFVILSLSLAREPVVSQSLCLAALVILLFDPQSLFSASFQLSFAATIGIIYLYPYFKIPFEPLPRCLRNTVGATIAVSLAAQAGVTPLIAYYFNRISLIGLVSNVFIVPLTGVITALGMALYLFHFISLTLTHYIAFITDICIKILMYLVFFFSSVPWASIHVPTPSYSMLTIYYLLLFAIFKIPLNRKSILAGILLLIVCIGGIAFKIHSQNKSFRITFLDVGNGDAIVVRFPGGMRWLIDGGGSYDDQFDPGEKILCPYFWAEGTYSFDRVLITHAHRSHYGGLLAIIKNFKVGEIAADLSTSHSTALLEIQNIAKAKQIPWTELAPGKIFVVAQSTVTILSPPETDNGIDDNCLVMAVEAYGKRILLTSDLGYSQEQQILSTYPLLNADVLQLPNHGIRSLSEETLKKLNPEFLVVSTGRDGVCEVAGRSVLSTRENGNITFILTRKGISYSCTH